MTDTEFEEPPLCSTCLDWGVVYVRTGTQEWEAERCPNCYPDRTHNDQPSATSDGVPNDSQEGK